MHTYKCLVFAPSTTTCNAHRLRTNAATASLVFRYGDDMAGNTVSLCVRRATYWCPELKADDPAKKGATARARIMWH